MNMNFSGDNFSQLQDRITPCDRCQRLRTYCQEVARIKRKAYRSERYWGKPVPGFGDPDAELVVVGLAPGAHGANRTGRMITGDRSGDWLYRALYEAGFSNQPNSTHLGDGLQLKNAYVTCVVKCAPPENKPNREEIEKCQDFLTGEFTLLKKARVFVALGKIAFEQTRALIPNPKSREGNSKFHHGAQLALPDDRLLLASYHPSQQNTFTGKLTKPMFDSIFQTAKQFLAGATAPLVLAAFLSSFAAAAERTTLRVGIGASPDTLDPVQTISTPSANVLLFTCETLVRLNEKLEILPGLAEKWKLDSARLTYTFELKKGVYFSNEGQTPEQFEASSVRWNLERILNRTLKVPSRDSFEPIDQIKVRTPHSIEIRLKRPAPDFLRALTMTSACMLSPRGALERGNTPTHYRTPITTGPYRITEVRASESIRLVRNPAYHGKKSSLSEILFRILPDATTRETLLLSDQLDLMTSPPIEDLKALNADPRFKVLITPTVRSIFIGISQNRPYLNDLRVRKALNYAVDKATLVRTLLGGLGEPLDSVLPKLSFGYCKNGEFPYRPELARRLLKEAGVPPGTRLELLSPRGRYPQDWTIAQAIQGYLGQVGLVATPKTMDWPSYHAALTTPIEHSKKDLFLLGYAAPDGDGLWLLKRFDSAHFSPGINYEFYKNPEVDRLIRKIEEEPDLASRKKLLCNASQRIWNDAPQIFLYSQHHPIVYNAKLEGIRGLIDEKFDALGATWGK